VKCETAAARSLARSYSGCVRRGSILRAELLEQAGPGAEMRTAISPAARADLPAAPYFFSETSPSLSFPFIR